MVVIGCKRPLALLSIVNQNFEYLGLYTSLSLISCFIFISPQPSANNDNYKIIGSRITASGCECIKRNGLQDDCPLPRCKGSPSCKITPFPRCEPFLGIPENQSKVSGHPDYQEVWGGDHCRCPAQ